jgi:hypothetical protein
LTKVQVIGDRSSPFALSLGAEIATFGLVSGLWNVQLPVYTSYHPTDDIAIYLNPRYIYQFTSYGTAQNGLSYVGGNGGLLFGKRNRFSIDFGYYKLGKVDIDSFGLFQFGVGGRFAFGGDDDSDSDSRSRRNRRN